MNESNILLIKTHAIGDLLLVSPAFRAIRHKHPNASISLLVGKWSSGIINTNPHIDTIIPFDEKILFHRNVPAIIKLVRDLRKARFDKAYIFHQSPFIHLLALAANIPTRIGFAQGWARTLQTQLIRPHAPMDRYVTNTFLDLVVEQCNGYVYDRPEVYVSAEADRFAHEILEASCTRGKPVITVFAGGGVNPAERISAKRLPLPRLAEVLNSITKHVPAHIVLIGGQADRESTEQLMELINSPCINFCGRTNLLETAAVIKRASLLITNDSAPLHMAVAVNTPSISFFGPSSARAFLPEDPIHIGIQSSKSCSPCYHFRRFSGCPDPCCLAEIKADEVTNHVLRLLSLQTIAHEKT
jgi:lipopolysaccharide heptosyltransferase II